MEVRGKIIAVQPIQTGEGRNGVWKKQDYVIEYDPNAQYPRKMMFNLWGDKIDQYNISEGQSLKVSFDIDCREYNGRWYNDIRAWKIEPDDSAETDDTAMPHGFVQPAAVGLNQASFQSGITSTEGFATSDETSDLPF